MTTLQEAREAAAKLNKLQHAAAQLPALEHAERVNNSKARLNTTRQRSQAAFDNEYQTYLKLGGNYKESFSNLLQVARETAKHLAAFLASRHRLAKIVDAYTGQCIAVELESNPELDVYKDGFDIKAKHENDLNLRPFDHALTPDGAHASQLYRVLRHLL